MATPESELEGGGQRTLLSQGDGGSQRTLLGRGEIARQERQREQLERASGIAGGDVQFELGPGGRGRPTQGSRVEALRRRVAGQFDEYSPEDIVVGENGQVRISEQAQRREARESAASESDLLSPGDFTVDETEEGFRTQLTEEAEDRVATEQIEDLEEQGFTPIPPEARSAITHLELVQTGADRANLSELIQRSGGGASVHDLRDDPAAIIMAVDPDKINDLSAYPWTSREQITEAQEAIRGARGLQEEDPSAFIEQFADENALEQFERLTSNVARSFERGRAITRQEREFREEIGEELDVPADRIQVERAAGSFELEGFFGEAQEQLQQRVEQSNEPGATTPDNFFFDTVEDVRSEAAAQSTEFDESDIAVTFDDGEFQTRATDTAIQDVRRERGAEAFEEQLGVEVEPSEVRIAEQDGEPVPRLTETGEAAVSERLTATGGGDLELTDQLERQIGLQGGVFSPLIAPVPEGATGFDRGDIDVEAGDFDVAIEDGQVSAALTEDFETELANIEVESMQEVFGPAIQRARAASGTGFAQAGGEGTRTVEPGPSLRATPEDQFGDFDFTIPEPFVGAGREPEDILRETVADVERATDPAIGEAAERIGEFWEPIAAEAADRDILTPGATAAAGQAVLPFGGLSAGRAIGEAFTELEPSEAEVAVGEATEATALGTLEGVRDIALFPVRTPVAIQEAAEFTVEGVEEHQAGRGQEFREEAGAAGVELAEQAILQAIEEPFRTTGQLGGSLVVSGGAIGAASRVSGTAGRAVSVGIQPGEELAIAAARRGAVPSRVATAVPGVRRGMIETGPERGQLGPPLGTEQDLGEGFESDIQQIMAEDLDVDRPPQDPAGVEAMEPEEGLDAFERRRQRIEREADEPLSETERRMQESERMEDIVERRIRERREAREGGLEDPDAQELDPLTERVLEELRAAEPSVDLTQEAGDEGAEAIAASMLASEQDVVSPSVDVLEEPTIGTEPGGDVTGLGITARLETDTVTTPSLAAEVETALEQEEAAIGRVEPRVDTREELGIESIGRTEPRARTDIRGELRQEQRVENRIENRVEERLESRIEERVEGRQELRTEPVRTEPRLETDIDPDRQQEERSEPDIEEPDRIADRIFESGIADVEDIEDSILGGGDGGGGEQPFEDIEDDILDGL